MTLFFLFLDYYVKDNNIYFNQDYTNETEMKRGQVWDIIEKIKENSESQSSYASWLKLFPDMDTETFLRHGQRLCQGSRR